MIDGVSLHRGVLRPGMLRTIRDFLSGLEYTRIERAAMHLCRSLQNDNTDNDHAHWLIMCLKAAGLDDYISFDDVSVVRYDRATDYVDWHSDGGPLLETGCEMGVLSLGAPRTMEFRRKDNHDAEASVLLEENDLVVSRAGFQAEYQHRIPPAAEQAGLRYSIVLFTHSKKKK